jgi:hypothetical protein
VTREEHEEVRDMLLRAWETINSLNSKISDLSEQLDKFQQGYQGACYACEPVGMLNERMSRLISEFFRMLDTVEESESGREFHPVTISCCRSMMIEPLNAILKEMKELVR